MWNPFGKANQQASTDDTQKMGMLQRLAMKKLERMTPAERNKLMQEATKPENKDKILAAMEQMKKMGQVSDEQLALAKKKLGL
jgi:hypothetical protein